MATKAELTTGSASAATEHTEEPQLAEPATFGKRRLQEDGAARKRICTNSPATEQTLGTSVDTIVTMQTSEDGPPMQASSFAAESDAATEHTAAGSITMMSMDAIVAELNAHLTDAARDVINAAQTLSLIHISEPTRS